LHADRSLLDRLRRTSLAGVAALTWDAAGVRLLEVYRETLAAHGRRPRVAAHAELQRTD